MSGHVATALEIWRSAWPLGWRWVIRGIEYTRCIEYPLVLAAAELRDGDHVLDIGAAPFSLLPLYLARRARQRMHLIDLAEYVHKIPARAAVLAPASKVFVSRQDARALGLRSASFDRVLAVSTLEHIPGDGDSKAAREISRVLRPGGRAVISVPFAPRTRDEYWDEALTVGVDADAPIRRLFRRRTGRTVFFQRRYDIESLQHRLVGPSGLRLTNMQLFGERPFAVRHAWWSRPAVLKALTNWFAPVLAAMFLRELSSAEADRAEGVILTLDKG